MHPNNIPWIVQWWVTPKLPKKHIFIPPDKRPKGIYTKLRVYFRKWVVHPLKRRIARYWLKILQNIFGLKVIGITGSAGKTTTKEIIASILSQKGETVWTPANVDPVYNIPSTILRCMPTTKYLILEMGVEFPREMDFYLWLARPKIGVITNIYQTHTQFFGNIDGVVEEKRELIEQLDKKGIAVLNKNSTYLQKIAKKIKAHVVWFGKDGLVRAEKTKITDDFKTRFTLHVAKESIEVTLPLLGTQFAENALAAAAIGFTCGAGIKEIKTGLENFEIPEHRMRPLKLKSGAIVLDDSYNNNPTAATLALQTLREAALGRKIIVVMGDMLELGEKEKEFHKELGREIAKSGAGYFIGIGQLSRYAVDEVKKRLGEGNIWWVEKENQVLPILKHLLKKDTITLIKGSRSIGLDKVIQNLTDL